MENTFWQANFWGIVGTASGALGLFISWLNWNYSKPKIEISELKLFRRKPEQINEWYSGKTKDQMRNHILDFELHTVIKNKKGGSGSIEKPLLIISAPNNFKEISINPRTKYYESIKIDSSTSETRTIDQGKAWNLEGGQTINDEIEYSVNNVDDLYDVVTNYKELNYSIRYRDNFGNEHIIKITEILNQR
jgi:hypothetical protein